MLYYLRVINSYFFMDSNNLEEKKQSDGVWLRRISFTVIILILVLVSFFAGLYLSGQNAVIEDLAKEEVLYVGELIGQYNVPEEGRVSQDIDFELFWETWDKLKERFVDKDKLSDKKMFYGALKGMVDSLDDPYTVFMNPKKSKEFEDDLAGIFEGIGAEIGIKNDILTIIAPLPDMPAIKAGIKSGDMVLSIDGETTMDMSVDDAVKLIRGPKGTEVVLTIIRKDEYETHDIGITRSTIQVNSVSTEMREDNILIVRISNFNEDTLKLFNEAVTEALRGDARGLIIDLRNNPGGYLDTAIEISSEWVEEGIVVVEQYNEDRKIDHLARGRARLKTIPTIVLINQGSASASEILSGALKDYGLATLVGMQTFGKGSVQTLDKLSDGSSLKITVAKWLTPNGVSINDDGIAPDYEVDLTLEDYNNNVDPQLDKAVSILNGEVEDELLEKEDKIVEEIEETKEEGLD